jgi:hypothetical protein
MECGSLFSYRLVNRLFIANGFTFFKFNLDGSVERLKACLVFKGYTQTYGIDYDETHPKHFSEKPSLLFIQLRKFSSIRFLISFSANLDWPLFQLDVKNSFLHGDLHEEVYMEQPHGFVA